MIKKDFDYLLKNDLRYGIIIAIHLFDKLKLKKISALLGKTESTVIHHLKELEKKDYIERDETKSNERGKFYRLTKKTLMILENIFQEFEKKDFESEILYIRQLTREEYNQRIIKGMREQFSTPDFDPLQVIKAGAAINSNIAKIMYQDLRDLIDRVINDNEGDKQKEMFLANLTMSMLSIPIETPQHIAEISELTTDYLRKLKNIEKRIREEKRPDMTAKSGGSNQYVFVFLGPLTGSLPGKHVEIVPI